MARENAMNPSEVEEGNRVTMVVSPHGLDTCPSEITGEVTDAPRESTKELMREGTTVMADIRVETDDGDTYTYNLDNGYVIGHHPGLGRVSDVARFRRFEKAEA